MSHFWGGFEKAAAKKEEKPSLGWHVLDKGQDGAALGALLGQLAGFGIGHFTGKGESRGLRGLMGAAGGGLAGAAAGGLAGVGHGFLGREGREIREKNKEGKA